MWLIIRSVTTSSNDIKHLIDWSPEMRLWPDPGFPVFDVMECIEGGEKVDSEDLNFAQRYLIRLAEEYDKAETDSRIDN